MLPCSAGYSCVQDYVFPHAEMKIYFNLYNDKEIQVVASMIHYRAVTAVNINIMVIWNVTPYSSLFR